MRSTFAYVKRYMDTCMRLSNIHEAGCVSTNTYAQQTCTYFISTLACTLTSAVYTYIGACTNTQVHIHSYCYAHAHVSPKRGLHIIVRFCVFMLQEVPEQWESCVLGRMQAIVAKQGRTRRRVAMAFDEVEWRFEGEHSGEGWLQCVVRHRESGQAVEVVNLHLPHKQYDVQVFAWL